MTNFSKFLKSKRKEVGLTQEELALKAGVGLRFVRNWSKGNGHCDWIK
jgi:transcriptional regulator with XRE-family HTH domain